MRRSRQVAISAGLTFLVLALLVVSEWSPLMELDQDVSLWATDLAYDHDTYRGAMKTATWLLNSGPVLVYAIAIATALAVAGRRATALWLTAVVSLGLVVNPLLKQLFDRDRPTVPQPVETFSGLSFPSGHAAGAALICSALAVVFWSGLGGTGRICLVVVGIVVPILCGWTRITLGGHYLSDVVGGTLWAVAWVAAWQPLLQRALIARASPPPPP